MEFSLNDEKGKGYVKTEKYHEENIIQLSDYYKNVIRLLGEDVDREGLKDTPIRVAKAMQFMTQGYNMNAEEILKSAMFREDYRQMVIVKDIELYSLCEHHMLPFYGKVHVAYIPDKYITGLSKIARVVDVYARRLQVQERLTTQIKDCIQNTVKPLGVAVVIEAPPTNENVSESKEIVSVPESPAIERSVATDTVFAAVICPCSLMKTFSLS